MKAHRLISAAAITAAGALSLAACGSDNATPTTAGSASTSPISCAAGKLMGAGSTFQANIVSQWIKDFDSTCTDATVDYQGVGSGAGISQFGAGTVDFGGSDATMKDAEQAAADKRCGAAAIHLPITAGGLAIAYKLDGIDALNLSPKVVAGIFQGTIKTWDDAAIAADNSGAALPKTPIQAIHRSDSSGSTKIFSGWLDKAAAGDWKLGVDKELKWADSIQGQKGSDGVTAAVADTEGAITYVELSFATSNDLSIAKVKNGAGEFVAPETANVSKALASATLPESGDDLRAKFDYATTTAGVYPVTGLSYEIVCAKGNSASTLPLLKAFLTYAAGAGQASAEKLGFAPLPSAVSDRVLTVIAALA